MMDRTLGIYLFAAISYGVFLYFFENETTVIKTFGFMFITTIHILILVYYKLEDIHESIILNNR
jgi:hypothetical protein